MYRIDCQSIDNLFFFIFFLLVVQKGSNKFLNCLLLRNNLEYLNIRIHNCKNDRQQASETYICT